MNNLRVSIDPEAATQVAEQIRQELDCKARIQDFVVHTVDNLTGVPINFMVNEDGVFSSHVMVRRGGPIDVPAGTWRHLDYHTEEKFEFARFVLRKQLEQWGVQFERPHQTLAEAEAYERTRIKP